MKDDILRRIGGPNAITWPSFGLTLSFTIVLAGIGAPATDAGWIWIVPAFVGQAAAYVVLWMAKLSVLRSTQVRPRPRRTIVTFGFAALVGGNASGVITRVVLGNDAGRGTPANGTTAALAILATVISFTIVASFAAVVVDAYREHSTWTSERNTKLRRLEYLRSSGSAHLYSVRQHQRTIVLNELESIRRKIPQQAFDELSSAIRHSAFEVLRPLSHRLATSPSEEIPQTPPVPPDVRKFLTDAVARHPIRPLAFAILSSIPSGFIVFFNTRPGRASMYVAFSLIVTVFLATLLARGLERLDSTWHRLAIGAVGLVLLSSCPAVIAFAVLDNGLASRTATTASFSAIVFGALGPILNAGRTAFFLERRDRSMIEAILAREELLLRQNDLIEREKLSKIVHGRIQSTLLACTLRLVQSGPNSNQNLDELEIRSWLGDTVQRLVDCVQAPTNVPDLASGLAEIESLWTGICTIDAEADHKSKTRLSEMSTSAILAIIEELCANAIRHAGARTIRCRVRWRSPEIVDIEVASDRQDEKALEHRSSRGLGSALLDELTIEWSTLPTRDGSKVVAKVPIAERQPSGADHTPRRTSGLLPPGD